MSTQNWNEMSSDEDDSWVNNSSSDESQQQKKQEKVGQKKTETNQTQSQAKEGQEKSTQNTVESKSDNQKKERKPYNNKDGVEKERKKFPTDQQILADLEGGKIEENTKIKVLRCFDEEEKSILEKNELKTKIYEFKEGCFIVNFKSKEELAQFIKEKIEKKYKFKLAVFINYKKDQDDSKGAKRGDKDKQKREYKNKDRKPQHYREKDDNNNKNFEKKERKFQKQEKHEQKREQKHNRKQRDPHFNKKQGKEHPKKQNRKELLSRNIKIDSKMVTVLGKQLSPEEFVKEIQNQKTFKTFTRVILYTPLKFYDYTEEISAQCYKLHKFGLVTALAQKDFERDPETIIELELRDGKEPVKNQRPANRMILKEGDNYFENVQNVEIHIINDGINFNEKDYFQQFRKNYGIISSNKSRWAVKAFGTNTGKLLRLHGIFTKNLPKHKFELSIGEEEGLAFACTHTSNLSEEIPKPRGKPDSSAVNIYLNNV